MINELINLKEKLCDDCYLIEIGTTKTLMEYSHLPMFYSL